VPEELLGAPAFTGVYLHADKVAGFGMWLPIDWTQFKMKRNHRGFLFSPYKDDINTCLLAEKHKLKFSVTVDDLPTLREGFHQGIVDLPGVEIESEDETLSDTVNLFEARFTYLDGEIRRKRWVRNIYWGDGQLVVIAQGRTPEDFEYWLSMFYNTLTTVQII
jgi:hypothetical protein